MAATLTADHPGALKRLINSVAHARNSGNDPIDPKLLLDALTAATAALRVVYVRTGDRDCTQAYDLAYEVLLRAERHGVLGLPIMAAPDDR